MNAKTNLILGIAFTLPFSVYMWYHMVAPSGVMNNFRASNGAYMYFVQNFLGPAKSYQQVYRPEFYQKEQSLSLYAYQKKIENLKKAESDKIVPEVHYPTTWH